MKLDLALASIQTPILPAWLVIPVAALLLLTTALHVRALQKDPEIPHSRRRIRTANGWLMALAIPLAAYAFCIAKDDNPRRFVLIWSCVVGVTGLVLLVACLDMLNTMRLAALARRRLREKVKELRASLVAGSVKAPITPESFPASPPHRDAPDRPSPDS